MPEKPVPKTNVSSRGKKPGTDFDIDVSLSGLGEDGTKDQQEAAAAVAAGFKRDEVLSRSRKGGKAEKRIPQEIEWEADGLEETAMDIPALPPLPIGPAEKEKGEDFELRMIRFLNGEIEKATDFLQRVKENPDSTPEAITMAERALEAHRKNYQEHLEKMQNTASETATDASLDDAFADIMDELNETGFEATGSPDDFPTEEQAKAAERQDELSRIRELTSQLDLNTEEGEWVIRQAEHLKNQSDRKQLIGYLTQKQKEAVVEFLKRKELERKTEQETAIQEEIKRRKDEERLKKEIGDFIMDTIVEGKGARIENLDAFERQGGKVYEPDSWGIRKIEWKGRFNALDGDNRLILPMIGQEWFAALQEFHPWHYQKDPGVSDFREQRLMAPVEKNGKHYFLTVDGELLSIHPPVSDVLKAFYDHREAAEVVEGEIIPEASAEHYVAYVQILAEELGAFAQRFESADKQALMQLKDTILSVGVSDGSLDWASVLISVKECVKKADLSPTVAFIKDRLFLRLAKTARAYDVEMDFNGLAELDDYNWQPYGRYDQGIIIRFDKDHDEKFTLIREGKLLYSLDEALDAIDPFTGKTARVSGKRHGMALYNFILKENGELFSEEWFKFIYPLSQGMFRIRTLDDRFNYLDPKTGFLIDHSGYDEAGDFDKNGRALVKQGGEKFYIDREGSRLQPIQVAASMVVDRHFDTAKTGPIPSIEELKARIKERTREAKGRHISHQLRIQFLEFIQSHQDSREELCRLFSQFRQTVNAQAGKINGHKSHEDHLIKMLAGKVEQSGLKRKLKQKLKDMVYNLRHKKPIWGKVEPLPISFTAVFESLIRNHPEDQDLLSLIMRLEMKMQHFSVSEYHSRALRESLRAFIFGKEYKLPLKTRRAVYNTVLTMLNNPDIQWGGSFTDRQAFKREHTERQIIRLCAFAEGGRVDEAYEGYQKLFQRKTVSHKKNALKSLALAFYQHLHQLSERYRQGDRDPELVARYKEARRKTVDILHQAYNQDPDDAEIQRLIDWLQLPKKPALPTETEKETTPSASARMTIKPRRSRLKILILLGMAAAAALVTHRHINSDSPESKKPAAIQPYEGNIKAGLGLAKIQIDQGNMRAAGILFRRLLKAEPKNAAIHAEYGSYLIKIDNIHGAEWHLKRALELDPANELARRELETLKTNGTK